MDLGINQTLNEIEAAELSKEFEVQSVATSIAGTAQSLEVVWPTVNLLVLVSVDTYYNFGLLSKTAGGDINTSNDLIIPADIVTEIKVPWGAINLATRPHLFANKLAGIQTSLHFLFEATGGTAAVRIVKQ